MDWATFAPLLAAQTEKRYQRAPQWGRSPVPTAAEVLDSLRQAQAGKVTFCSSSVDSTLGELKMWEMEHIGERPVTPYLAHGGFEVRSEGIYRSRLTADGAALLAALSRPGAVVQSTCPHTGRIDITENTRGSLVPVGARAVACSACGRLFGWLDRDERFTSWNPESPSLSRERPPQAEAGLGRSST